MADSTPVVAITGQVPTGAMGTDAFQEAPIVNIMGSCAKHVFLVTRPEQLGHIMEYLLGPCCSIHRWIFRIGTSICPHAGQ
jgi:thiamine pyrophosphate-dependent acetolactate synthase large subunit-like protein